MASYTNDDMMRMFRAGAMWAHGCTEPIDFDSMQAAAKDALRNRKEHKTLNPKRRDGTNNSHAHIEAMLKAGRDKELEAEVMPEYLEWYKKTYKPTR